MFFNGFIWSGRWESNPRHTAWEAVVLPLNYARRAPFLDVPVPSRCNWARWSRVAGLITRTLRKAKRRFAKSAARVTRLLRKVGQMDRVSRCKLRLLLRSPGRL